MEQGSGGSHSTGCKPLYAKTLLLFLAVPERTNIQPFAAVREWVLPAECSVVAGFAAACRAIVIKNFNTAFHDVPHLLCNAFVSIKILKKTVKEMGKVSVEISR